MELHEYTTYDALGLAELVARGEVSAAELADCAFAAMDAVDSFLNAVIARLDPPVGPDVINPDAPFAGVPFLLKDLGHGWGGVACDMGSRIAQGYVEPHDSDLAARLRASGLCAVGRTNTPEFGVNGMTAPLLYGPTNNPWDLSRTPGGSSGGSAAAVAAGIVPMAHASDGGGSIRDPAAWCGLVGLKPSRGRNPVGPDESEGATWITAAHVVSRSVRDTAAALDVTAGPCGASFMMLPRPEHSFLSEVTREPGRLRIAFSSRLKDAHDTDPDCIEAVEQAARYCADLGHDVEEVTPDIAYPDMSATSFAIYCALILPGVEALATIMGREPGPGTLEPQTLASLERARTMRTPELMAALGRMTAMTHTMSDFMTRHDVFLTPTVSCVPPFTETFDPATYAAGDLSFWGKEMDAYAFCPLASLTGQPAMSLPLYMSDEKLPVGVQITGRMGDEATLFRLAGQLEQAHPWAERRPPVHAGVE